MKAMFWLRLGAVVMLGLPACRADDDGDTVKTGTFVDGAVAGLHFRTPTQAGLTNSAGEFLYNSGESVTFAVGGIVLGSATGAAQISPFDLFGIALPTTEIELRSQVSDPAVTAFDRALNVAVLLHALDTDQNAANGIDLGAQNELLADATVDFSVDHNAFVDNAVRKLAGVYSGVSYAVIRGRVLDDLYASIGVSLTVHQVRTEANDAENDGVVDDVAAYEYDTSGRLVVWTSDGNNNGIVEYRQEATFDERGLWATYVTHYDGDENGVDDTREVTAYTYDAAGNAAQEVTESFDGAVLERRYVAVKTYDAFGNVLSETNEDDSNGDGVVDDRSTIVSVYNAAGARVSQRAEHDGDVDGTIDNSSLTTFTFDAAGYLTQQEVVYDYDADGTNEARYVYVYTRDLNGNMLTRSNENFGAGGVLTSRYTYTYTYDAAGNELTRDVASNDNGDGAIDSYASRASTYDGSGRLLTQANSTDSDADTVINTRNATVYTYDAYGNIVLQVSTRDSNADGTADRRDVFTVTVDANGNVTRELDEEDTNNDGTVDSSSVSVYDYSAIEGAPGSVLESFGQKGAVVAL